MFLPGVKKENTFSYIFGKYSFTNIRWT